MLLVFIQFNIWLPLYDEVRSWLQTSQKKVKANQTRFSHVTPKYTNKQVLYSNMGEISSELYRLKKKGDFLKFCFYSTLKVSNITLMVLVLKSNSWASLFLLTLSVIANYLIMSRRYLLLFF